MWWSTFYENQQHFQCGGEDFIELEKKKDTQEMVVLLKNVVVVCHDQAITKWNTVSKKQEETDL